MSVASISASASGFDSGGAVVKLHCNMAVRRGGGALPPFRGIRGIMALLAKLQLRQAQTLVITPQLLQGIRLLQMSSLELERFLATEIEQNPLLENESSAA